MLNSISNMLFICKIRVYRVRNFFHWPTGPSADDNNSSWTNFFFCSVWNSKIRWYIKGELLLLNSSAVPSNRSPSKIAKPSTTEHFMSLYMNLFPGGLVRANHGKYCKYSQSKIKLI